MTNLRELARLDGVAQAELVARGEVSADELLAACAARIEAMNPLLRAITSLDLDRARAARRPDGPLAGVPFLVKDVTAYPGLPWTMGSRALAGNVAGFSTPYAARIEASGLVTLGTTATSEFGLLGSTETALHGVTHNPWDLATSAAGSSGGAAAAVASGMVPLAHANDGGGSIRIPASSCGLFGFKPSRGRCVAASPGASAFERITGDHVITRSVRDSALFLALTEDADGPWRPVGRVEAPIDRRLHVATWTGTLLGGEPEPAVRRAYDEAVALCASLGHEVEPIAPPAIDGAALCEAFFDVAGAAVGAAVEMLASMRGRPLEREALELFTRGLVERARERGPEAQARAQGIFEAASASYLAAIAGFDVALTPTLATSPWRIGHLSPFLGVEALIDRTARAVGYTPIHNLAGCPAMSVPLHFPAAGAPIGSHFAAAPGADALLLALAYQLEAVALWRDRWAPWSYPVLYPG